MMKMVWLSCLLLTALSASALPVQAQEIPIVEDIVNEHCALPYPIDPCLYDYLDWIRGVRGPVNLVCQMVRGEECIH